MSQASREALIGQLRGLFGVLIEQVQVDEPFAERLAGALAPAPPAPLSRSPAVLDPFAIYEQGWESMLRDRLAPLSIEQLRDVIHQFELDATGRSLALEDRRALIELVVKVTSRLGG